MQLSLVFRAVLLISLLWLEGAAFEKMTKRKRKTSCAERTDKSNNNMTKLWVTLDSTVNIPIMASPSPERSISPWTYKTSFDNSRTPSKISEAQCERTGCLTNDGKEDWGLESKPIYYEINTLRRVKNKNMKQYALKLETKTVSLGCTCVSPIVVPQT